MAEFITPTSLSSDGLQSPDKNLSFTFSCTHYPDVQQNPLSGYFIPVMSVDYLKGHGYLSFSKKFGDERSEEDSERSAEGPEGCGSDGLSENFRESIRREMKRKLSGVAGRINSSLKKCKRCGKKRKIEVGDELRGSGEEVLVVNQEEEPVKKRRLIYDTTRKKIRYEDDSFGSSDEEVSRTFVVMAQVHYSGNGLIRCNSDSLMSTGRINKHRKFRSLPLKARGSMKSTGKPPLKQRIFKKFLSRCSFEQTESTDPNLNLDAITILSECNSDKSKAESTNYEFKPSIRNSYCVYLMIFFFFFCLICGGVLINVFKTD